MPKACIGWPPQWPPLPCRVAGPFGCEAWHEYCERVPSMPSRGYASTHVGGRSRNEDAFLVRDDIGVYAVADGMGGYEGGGLASRLAVTALEGFFGRADPSHDEDFGWVSRSGETVAEARLALALRQADREIQRHQVGELTSMGTTVAALVVADSFGLVGHVGDSRIYRMRRRQLTALTRDHSCIIDRADARVGGSVGAAGPTRAVTRALGAPGCTRPDFELVDVQAGDRFLLCSDGLTDVLETSEIAAQVGSLPAGRVAESLVARACAHGAHDNVTVVIVDIA